MGICEIEFSHMGKWKPQSGVQERTYLTKGHRIKGECVIANYISV